MRNRKKKGGKLMHDIILILIGAIITWISTCLSDYIRSKREERIRLRQKREDIYLKFYQLVITAYKVREENVDLKDKDVVIPNYIELEAEMELYASSKINQILSKSMLMGKTVETYSKEEIEELIRQLRKDLCIKN